MTEGQCAKYKWFLQVLLEDVMDFSNQLTALGQLSDQLTPHMDNATIINITARESSLNQRLTSMQQVLARHVRSLEEGLDKHSRFDTAYDNIDRFLSYADTILRMEDPNQSASEGDIRHRLDQFKSLSNQFTEKLSDLETVNMLGYRLSLNEADSMRMRRLNQRWYRLAGETSERYKRMQGYLLMQQSFSEKCEEWMLFLAQVEKDLASEIAGNYEALLEQQQAYEASVSI